MIWNYFIHIVICLLFKNSNILKDAVIVEIKPVTEQVQEIERHPAHHKYNGDGEQKFGGPHYSRILLKINFVKGLLCDNVTFAGSCLLCEFAMSSWICECTK